MKSRISGKRGRVTAGIVGGLFLALTSCVFLSLYYPSEAFDRMFVGGLMFGPFWAGGCLFAYYGKNTLWAWIRVMIPTLAFLAADIYGFANLGG